ADWPVATRAGGGDQQIAAIVEIERRERRIVDRPVRADTFIGGAEGLRTGAEVERDTMVETAMFRERVGRKFCGALRGGSVGGGGHGRQRIAAEVAETAIVG